RYGWTAGSEARGVAGRIGSAGSSYAVNLSGLGQVKSRAAARRCRRHGATLDLTKILHHGDTENREFKRPSTAEMHLHWERTRGPSWCFRRNTEISVSPCLGGEIFRPINANSAPPAAQGELGAAAGRAASHCSGVTNRVAVRLPRGAAACTPGSPSTK